MSKIESDIKKNYLYSMAYQILQMIIPLITAPYVSRVLGADGVGVYSYTHSVAYYFFLAGSLGVNNYGNRSIAQVRENQEKVNGVFSSLFQVQLVTSTISLFVYTLWILYMKPENSVMFMAQFIYILSATFDINWLFFGLEKFKITVTRKAVIKLLTAGLIFIFVRSKEDLIIYAIIMNVGYFIGQCYLWLSIKRYVRFQFQPISAMIPHFKPLLILFVPVFATSIYRVMDKIMIGRICTVRDVGIYENADKIIVVCLGIVSALGTVMLPRISNLYANGKFEECKKYYRKSIQFIIFITVALAFGIAAIADRFVIIFYGSEFVDCGKVLAGLAFAIFFVGISNTTRNQVLIPMGKDGAYLVSVTGGAIVNLICNLVLIPQIGVFGAVVGTLIAECTVAILQIYPMRKILEIGLYIKDNLIYPIIGGIMFWTVQRFLSVFSENTIVAIVFAVAIGAFVYISLSVVYWRCSKNIMWEMIQSKKYRNE